MATYAAHSEYETALKNGDLETAQAMAEMAAKQAHLPGWFVRKYPHVRLFGSSLESDFS